MKLLETTSPQYLRRLVRELNANESAYYNTGIGNSMRIQRAKLNRSNAIEVKVFIPLRLAAGSFIEALPVGSFGASFHDGNGRELVASRS
jgi:hypothetical protein